MRVIFLDFDGVLNAVAGPAGTMRQFVWAPILEVVLAPHPDVRLVIHASARDHMPANTIIARLGNLGNRVVGIAPPRIGRWEAIQRYLAINQEISNYRILDDAPGEFPTDLPELIVCMPNQGVSDLAVQHRVLEWLENGCT